MSKRLLPTTDPWLTRYAARAHPEARLFCFHYAGGSAHIFQSWINCLPDWLEIFAITLPGRGTLFNEKPFTNLEHLIPVLSRKLFPLFDKPYVMFGHSLGALIAFEIARYTQSFNSPSPIHLFLGGHEGPRIPQEEKNYLLSDLEFIDVLRKKQGTPKAILENTELMAILLPVLKTDFQLSETYKYKPNACLNCPITVFAGTDEENTDEDFMAWKHETTKIFRFKRIQGNHFFIHNNQKIIMESIVHSIKQAVEMIMV